MSSAKDLMYPQKFYWTSREPTRAIKELLDQLMTYWNSKGPTGTVKYLLDKEKRTYWNS